ncbi:MAG TPA: hypothetical protein DCX06_09925 [Opitutae bacterium]|nr:hypothetical protein [Opitutae bacterium]
MNTHSKSTSNTLEVDLRSLLQTVTSATADSLIALADDTDISYLIILETAAKDKRKFLPAGPGLDFRSPKDAAGQTIGGMRMSGFVDMAKARANQAAQTLNKNIPTRETSPSQTEKKLKQRLEWTEKENYELENRISNAKKQILTRNQVIQELKKQVSALQKRLDEHEHTSAPSDSQMSSRDSELEAAEEELITRMNEYMEKEAELEQREENLFYRERKLHEKENSTIQTA